MQDVNGTVRLTRPLLQVGLFLLFTHPAYGSIPTSRMQAMQEANASRRELQESRREASNLCCTADELAAANTQLRSDYETAAAKVQAQAEELSKIGSHLSVIRESTDSQHTMLTERLQVAALSPAALCTRRSIPSMNEAGEGLVEVFLGKSTPTVHTSAPNCSETCLWPAFPSCNHGMERFFLSQGLCVAPKVRPLQRF